MSDEEHETDRAQALDRLRSGHHEPEAAEPSWVLQQAKEVMDARGELDARPHSRFAFLRRTG